MCARARVWWWWFYFLNLSSSPLTLSSDSRSGGELQVLASLPYRAAIGHGTRDPPSYLFEGGKLPPTSRFERGGEKKSSNPRPSLPLPPARNLSSAPKQTRWMCDMWLASFAVHSWPLWNRSTVLNVTGRSGKRRLLKVSREVRAGCISKSIFGLRNSLFATVLSSFFDPQEELVVRTEETELDYFNLGLVDLVGCGWWGECAFRSFLFQTSRTVCVLKSSVYNGVVIDFVLSFGKKECIKQNQQRTALELTPRGF